MSLGVCGEEGGVRAHQHPVQRVGGRHTPSHDRLLKGYVTAELMTAVEGHVGCDRQAVQTVSGGLSLLGEAPWPFNIHGCGYLDNVT